MSKIYGEANFIRSSILNLAQKNKQVVYGGQAANKNLPLHLRRKTKDFDVYSKQPKQSAEELSKVLNKGFSKDEFTVERAKYDKTFKVKRGKETIADYTSTTNHPKSKNEFGVKYADLDYQKKKLKEIVKNPDFKYRWEKDKDMLNRIKQSEGGDFVLK